MPHDVQALVFALAIGVVLSGTFANVFGLIMDTRSAFHLPATSDVRRLAILGVLLFAAPHIVFCAARRALRQGELAPEHTFGICGVCSLWSFGVGYLIFSLMVF